MENKVIVLNKDGKWLELTNCFLVGAYEEPGKTMYHSVFFTAPGLVTKDELLKRAEAYIAEMKKA